MTVTCAGSTNPTGNEAAGSSKHSHRRWLVPRAGAWDGLKTLKTPGRTAQCAGTGMVSAHWQTGGIGGRGLHRGVQRRDTDGDAGPDQPTGLGCGA